MAGAQPWVGVFIGFGIGLPWLLVPKAVIAFYSALTGGFYRSMPPNVLRVLSAFPLVIGGLSLFQALRLGAHSP